MRLCRFKTVEELRKRMDEEQAFQEWTGDDAIAKLALKQRLIEEERYLEQEDFLWEIEKHWLPPQKAPYYPPPRKGA
jgi:hypothetical protein